MTPRIAITSGEPAGIGPDLCAALLAHSFPAQLIVLGDQQLIADRAAISQIQWQIPLYQPHIEQKISAIHFPLSIPISAGRLDPRNSGYVLSMLDHATAGCMNGEWDAMVTLPVQKSVINDAGIPFTGHTEYLAAKINTDRVVMMLCGGDLRVALATTHVPVSQISTALNAGDLEKTIRILVLDLQQKFAIENPRILVAGLNPHAGEDGHLGNEEKIMITPVLEKLRHEGMQLIGPLPADTLFQPKYLNEADAVLAMYHDQGLPVLKYASFGKAVNVTLGLPLIRTSVDHGTALDIAGTGKADSGSFFAAIDMAIDLVNRTTLKRFLSF